jgi:alkanesulfonate monooxygenase SsuD/methylene tetrahydromethanopterin reductase-like flavin-dependent oxidoreductase (luciferase family)
MGGGEPLPCRTLTCDRAAGIKLTLGWSRCRSASAVCIWKCCRLAPKPIQRPYPAIMNAGGSEQGQHFSAKYSDIAFIQFDKHDLDFARSKVHRYRLAREEYGRDIQIWSFGYVVQRETEKEAKEFLHYYVHEKGDWVAAENLMRLLASARSQ